MIFFFPLMSFSHLKIFLIFSLPFFSLFFPLTPGGRERNRGRWFEVWCVWGVCFLRFPYVSHTQYCFSTSLSQAFLRCVVLCERAFVIPIILIFLALLFPAACLFPLFPLWLSLSFFSPPLWFPPLTQSIFHFGLSTYSCSCFLSMYWVSNFCFWPGLQQQ